jgi:hypothetical protein
MTNQQYYKLISNSELHGIYLQIKFLIKKYFNKLILSHQKLIIKYLFKLIVIFSIYYYNEDFTKQLYLNNYQDIFSLLVLLMPFFNLKTSNEIVSLDEIFLNKNNNAKNFETSYYIDHKYLEKHKKEGDDYLLMYFKSSFLGICDTLSQTHCLIFPNWINIFPYTMETYKLSNLYKNFEYIYLNKNFNQSNLTHQLLLSDKHTDYNFQSEINFTLGFPILYGTIYSFLYSDIKNIKWMIYDLNINDQLLIPNIIYLGDVLNLNNIINKPWNKLNINEIKNYEDLWKKLVNYQNINQESLRSLVSFYLRWEKDNNKINLIQSQISKQCFEIINTYLLNIYEEDEINKDEHNSTKNDLNKCIKECSKKIKFENIYNYIYECMHKFRYTWYSYYCLSDDKNILNKNEFLNKYLIYFQKDYLISSENLNNNNLYYITLKNIYNYCKSLLHFEYNDKYKLLSLEPKWDNLINAHQENFIEKLILKQQIRNNDEIDFLEYKDWFNIKNNLRMSYPNLNDDKINELFEIISDKLFNSNLFVNVIFQTLVYNGMLTFYKFNPKLSDSRLIPNKNTNFERWNEYILKNIDIKMYENSYHPFSNTLLSSQTDVINTIKNSKWYTNFGADWIAQIQIYHHYVNNRVMFITGATGAGKSTVAPFMLLYAVKIINFNNNAKVVCTQTRTQAVKNNSEKISENIGLPMIFKKNEDLDKINNIYRNTRIGEAIQQDINYIQYKHKNGSIIDELYHPCLRFYTDGSLYNVIKKNSFLKKKVNDLEENNEYLSTNIFDILLVDEAHEHSIYIDSILTLAKFSTYINNQITLGLISATMEYDELIYRRYFLPIDDNWKYPINVNIYCSIEFNNKLINYLVDKNLIDRRIHLSIPFGGMNFDVKEFPNDLHKFPICLNTFTDFKLINKSVLTIVKHILLTSTSGDILIFQPGESNIKKLVTEINSQTPSNILAIPFYSKLEDKILENYIKKIANQDVRKSLRYPKDKYTIDELPNIPENELLPFGTYTRFIIVATNIAEPSITIDSLEYVIDTGNQKIAVYDYETNLTNLVIKSIAIPNLKQRIGRVGRVKPGFVYLTYDKTKLEDKIICKINIDNISEIILDLITSSKTKLINQDNDPYKTTDYKLIPSFLQKQYSYVEYEFIETLFDYKTKIDNDNLRGLDIIYPFDDNKYDIQTLEDLHGKFYIIHPCEDYFIRNPETLEIISIKPNYYNKITKIIEYGKIQGMISDNVITKYGLLLNSLVDFMEFTDNSFNFVRIILDCLSFNIKINSEIFKKIILFFVFKIIQINLNVSNSLLGKADFLIYSALVDNSFFDSIDFEKDIMNNLNNNLQNLRELITIKVDEIINKKFINDKLLNITLKKKYNVEQINKILIQYFIIKFKIEIIIKNEIFITKKYFIEIVNNLQNLIDNNTFSVDYLYFVNTFISYYKNCNDFMEINIIKNLIIQVKKNSDIDQKLDFNINKINKILENSSLYENESLKKIKLLNNINYHQDIKRLFYNLSEYDRLCFLIIKNMQNNIVRKISDTDFYINYYKKDINRIYGIEKKNYKFPITKVSNDLRNFYIFIFDMNDIYDINSIISLSELVVKFLNFYFKYNGINLFSKKTTFNKEINKELYEDKYEYIIKNIDKINNFIIKN